MGEIISLRKTAENLCDKFSIYLDPVFDQYKNFIRSQENIREHTQKSIRNTLETLGIFSLSTSYRKELMWSHYADNHKGFVIEYDSAILNKTAPLFKVLYEDDMPVFDLEYTKIRDKPYLEQSSIIQKAFATKSKCWEYEDEYRYIYKHDGLQKIPENSISAIYFGKNMLDDRKQEMIDMLKDKNIVFNQISLVPNKYLLESTPYEQI